MSTRSRRRFDDDDFAETTHPTTPTTPPATHDDPASPAWSTYADCVHGPQPPPPWVITSPGAIDDDLGVLKTGKEADVSLVRRTVGQRSSLMAAKRFRDAHHRAFHRDAGYLEGRRLRKSRETRAVANRTAFGRQVIAQQWAIAEFHVLGTMWSAGASVPYPVQLDGTELLMEFVGTADGVAAPRLAQVRVSPGEAAELFGQLRDSMLTFAEHGYAHGDLSPYNILVHDGRLVLIDLPQAVDLVGNPQGFEFLRRDCRNICAWFESQGVPADADALADECTAAST